MTVLSPRAALIARRVSALYCATYGTGTPLLLIHGFGTSGTSFQSLVPTLAAHHAVLVPDLRGQGHSRCLPGAGIAQMSADLDDLLDLLHISRCTVLGYAGGGLVAHQFACAYPQRVNKLVLINTVAHRASTLRGQIEHRLRAGLARITGDTTAASASDALDARARTTRVQCPALVIASAGDPRSVQHARDLADQLPDVQLRLTPGGPDTCLSTHAPALLERLLPWLKAREATC